MNIQGYSPVPSFRSVPGAISKAISKWKTTSCGVLPTLTDYNNSPHFDWSDEYMLWISMILQFVVLFVRNEPTMLGYCHKITWLCMFVRNQRGHVAAGFDTSSVKNKIWIAASTNDGSCTLQTQGKKWTARLGGSDGTVLVAAVWFARRQPQFFKQKPHGCDPKQI